MLMELNEDSFLEQIESDLIWIQEIINQPGKMFSQTAKNNAAKLFCFLNDNKAALDVFKEYDRMRNDLLSDITHNDGSEVQTELFEGGEC